MKEVIITEINNGYIVSLTVPVGKTRCLDFVDTIPGATELAGKKLSEPEEVKEDG